jgi:hypothetical protein
MKRCALSFLLIFCCLPMASCLTPSGSGGSPGTSLFAPKPQSNPTNDRINAINAELTAISSETTKLQQDETIAEKQRNESLIALGEIHGGPKMPKGMFDEETYIDPGMMISMHNQNVTIANQNLGEVRTKIASLTDKVTKLKTERATLEASLPAPSKGTSPMGSCFTPDTLVLTKEGSIPISLLSKGQNVMAYDEGTQKSAYRPVVQALSGRENHYYILNGDLRVTGLHRFMTDTGWLRASELKPGMLLQTTEGLKPIESIRLVQADIDVANLEVEQDHDFYVFDGRTGYLVHNSGGGGGGGGGAGK